ncbi:hypothetical protein LTR85_004912 [Meristemomyces frigidus]|nr:hypothetical protein LTR85_004912 [Meristemomyces frigidus]
MSTEAREAKKALRKDIKQRLSALTEEQVTKQSRIAQEIITSLPQFKNAKRISIYLSMPTSEARTDSIVRDALGTGKKVFVPYIYSAANPQTASATTKTRKVMDMLRLTSTQEFEGLGRDSWGIPHLPSGSVSERENAMGGLGRSLSGDGTGTASNLEGDECGGLDLIVVPGVAFDSEMSRMGHGAGFYDNLLTRFCTDGKRSKPFLVGLCLAEQVLPPGRILMQEWDWEVDAVAVGDGRLLTLKDGE